MSLASRPVVAFAPTTDAPRARAFFEGTLGLRFVEDDGFALVFDANGTMLRVARVKSLTPAPFTILGWDVDDIHAHVATLAKRGVVFETYGFPGQDASGVWSAPGGSKVAWFKDPDGSILSISQHA